MTPVTYSSETWAEIRRRYEQGETAGMISRSLGGAPSKIAINNKANKQGWERLSVQLPVGNDGNNLVVPADMDPRRKAALQALADGGNYTDAAIAATVDTSTFRLWRQDQEYQRLCEAAISGLKLEMLGHVKRGAAREPKYAAWFLQHHPATRGEFGGTTAAPRQALTFNVLGHVSLGLEREPVEPSDAPLLEAL